MYKDGELSARQRDVYGFIVQFCENNPYPPTVREIGAELGIKSTSNVHAYLKALERKGYIRMGTGKQRTISIVQPDKNTKAGVANIPVVGAVAAGNPILAFDDVRGYRPFPAEDLRGAASDVFMLDIEGESMIKAGIFNGDEIVVNKGLSVQNGDIAVVRVSSVYGDAATVKRVYFEKDFLRLQPENDTMEPIVVPVQSAQIIGKVIGLYRQY